MAPFIVNRRPHNVLSFALAAIIVLFLISCPASSQKRGESSGEACATPMAVTSVFQGDTVTNLKILLVQFTDVSCRMDSDGHTARYSVQDFEYLLGSEGVYVSPAMHSPDGDEVFGSMNDYYRKMSGGRMKINAYVINKIDGTTGRPVWLTLSQTKQYYKQLSAGDSPIFAHAIKAALNAGMDPYTDGNTSLVIIYAGNVCFQMSGLNPMAQGPWYIMSEVQGRPYGQEGPGATFSRIGIHCHEFGHTIGLGHCTGGRADLMCGGTSNGSVDGNAPAPVNAIVRVRRGWANVVSITGVIGQPVDVSYSLTEPTIYTMVNERGDKFFIENRRFDQTMTIGATTVPDYNNVAFFPPAGPHHLITQGILVWRLNTSGNNLDPGYSTEGLVYASGRFGRTYPENDPSDTDDGVPFPGVSNNRILSPWSDPRNPYGREADYFNPSGSHYTLFVPNTKGGSAGGMEILSEDREGGSFRVMFSTSQPPNPELSHQSNVDSLGAYDSRRTLCRDEAGGVHQLLGVGGEIFYRGSTDGGLSWSVPALLSNANGGNSVPCVTMTGSTVLGAWQVQASGNETYVIHSRRSTDGGYNWTGLSTLGWSYHCGAAGPYPSIAGFRDSSALLVYRTEASLVSSLSRDGGLSWGGPAHVPTMGVDWTSPSLVIDSGTGKTSRGMIAYCTDGLSGPRQIVLDDFAFDAVAWGSPTNISDGLPSHYTGFRNPNFISSAGALNIAWDARDAYAGGRPVIISRGADRPHSGSSYRILKGEWQNDLSVLDIADKVLGESKGCARVLTLADSSSGGAVSIEIGLMTLLHEGGRVDSIRLSEAPAETLPGDDATLLNAGRSNPFTLDRDALCLQLVSAVYGSDPASLFSSPDGCVGFEVLRGESDTVIAVAGGQSAALIQNGERRLLLLSLPVAALLEQGGDARYSVRPFVHGLRKDIVLMTSLGVISSNVMEVPADTMTTGIDRSAGRASAPRVFALEQNYPNPFNPSTTIRFGLPHSASVSLVVYNSLGQQVAELVRGVQEEGYHEVRFQSGNLASGVYFYRLRAGSFEQTKKLMLLH